MDGHKDGIEVKEMTLHLKTTQKASRRPTDVVREIVREGLGEDVGLEMLLHLNSMLVKGEMRNCEGRVRGRCRFRDGPASKFFAL